MIFQTLIFNLINISSIYAIVGSLKYSFMLDSIYSTNGREEHRAMLSIYAIWAEMDFPTKTLGVRRVNTVICFRLPHLKRKDTNSLFLQSRDF